MTRVVKALIFARRPATAVFAASVVLSGFGLSAQAYETLPASAAMLRSTVVAMALADAALPLAGAVADIRDGPRAVSRGAPVAVPPSSAAMKPDTSGAMASMRTASARRYGAAYDNASTDRRIRRYRDPFVLILGVAY